MYTAEISRRNPTCFVFLLDQSGSMAAAFASDPSLRKADYVADVANRILHDLVIRAAGQGEVLNRYEVGVIGYGATVGPALSGKLGGRNSVSISELAESPASIEQRVKREPDGAGGILERPVKFPLWLRATADGGTPMVQALTLVRQLCEEWIGDHPSAFPPTVVHITDGESTDGDPATMATALRALATSDGNLLLFNCHISSQSVAPVQFPSTAHGLPDAYARALFGMSSLFPPPFCKAAEQLGMKLASEARGFVFNADPVALVHFFEIGTRGALMAR